jgi:hypothetical protein
VEPRGVFGRALDGRSEVGDGAVEIAPAVPGKGPRLKDGRIGRIDPNRVAVVGDCCLVISTRGMGVSAAEIGCGVVRTQPERLGVVCYGSSVIMLGSVSKRTILEARSVAVVKPD